MYPHIIIINKLTQFETLFKMMQINAHNLSKKKKEEKNKLFLECF